MLFSKTKKKEKTFFFYIFVCLSARGFHGLTQDYPREALRHRLVETDSVQCQRCICISVLTRGGGAVGLGAATAPALDRSLNQFIEIGV